MLARVFGFKVSLSLPASTALLIHGVGVRIVRGVTSRANPPAPGLAARARGTPRRELWGYGVWFFVAIVFAIPEVWAGFGSPPWPTLSITIAHLEGLWPGTRVVIVAIIVFLIFQAVRYPFRHTGEFDSPPGRPPRGRTVNGRLTKHPDDVAELAAVLYLLGAIAIMIGGALNAAHATSDQYVVGYVIWGLFWVFLVGVPNALAFFFARDIAFPTLFRTIIDLENRWRPAAVLTVFALVILALHLVFFPWPNIPI
jgi:hypothetical protein